MMMILRPLADHRVRVRLKTNIFVLLFAGVTFSCVVQIPNVKSDTAKFTTKSIPGPSVIHQRREKSEFGNIRFESFVKDIHRKVIFNVIQVEFGAASAAASEWSWVARYVDGYWDQFYNTYESQRMKSAEQIRIERNITNCLDEVGHANSQYCEDELINHLIKESALKIVSARVLAADMSNVAAGKITMINEQIFESTSTANEGILGKFLFPMLTLKYFFPPADPSITFTLSMLVNHFIEGDTDSDFSMSRKEFDVMEVNKSGGGGNLPDSVLDEYFNKIDINHDGHASWFEFLLVPICTIHICFKDLSLPDVGVGGGGGGVSGAKSLADQIKAGDLNHDGLLSMDELSVSAKDLVLTVDNEDLVDVDDIFDLFDEDQDGEVTYMEIDKVFQDVQMEPPPPPPPQFVLSNQGQGGQGLGRGHAHGHGHDGPLTKDDLIQIAKVAEHRLGQKFDVERMMMMLDKNGNGVIDKNEQQLISNLLKLL